MMAAKGHASIEAQNVYARAQKLAQEVGDGPLPFQISWLLWVSHAARAEHHAGLEAAQECLRLAELARDPSLLVGARHAMGNAMMCLGRFAEGLTHFEQGTAVYDIRHHASIVALCGQDSGVVCHAYRGWPLWFLGYSDQARKCIDEGLALAQKLAHPLTTATAAFMAGCVHPLVRDPVAALREAELAISLSEEYQFEYWRAAAQMVQGWALTEQGLLDTAITRLRDGLTSIRASGAKVTMPQYMAMLADALRKAGRVEEARDCLAEAQAILEETGENWWEPELLRLKAEILLQRYRPGCDDEAEGCLRQALQTSRERDAKSLELRAATSLSRLLFKQGRKSEAHRTLAAVYSWFTEGFETPDLREAKALIDQLS
jgi:adenylate cyclase